MTQHDSNNNLTLKGKMVRDGKPTLCAAKVKSIAQQKGLSLKELADRINVSYRSLLRWTSQGGKPISDHFLSALSDVLCCDPSVLCQITSAERRDAVNALRDPKVLSAFDTLGLTNNFIALAKNASTIGKDSDYGKLNVYMALVSFVRSDYSEASRLADLAIKQGCNDPGELCLAHSIAKICLTTSGKSESAKEHQRFIKKQDLTDYPYLRLCKFLEAQTQLRNGELKKARELFLELFGDEQKWSGVGDRCKCAYFLGVCCSNLRDYEAAQSWFTKALELAEPLNFGRLLVDATMGLCKIYIETESRVQAHASLTRASAYRDKFNILKSLDYHIAEAKLHSMDGNHKEARKILITILDECDNAILEAHVRLVIAEVEVKMGYRKEGMKSFRKAERVLRKSGSDLLRHAQEVKERLERL